MAGLGFFVRLVKEKIWYTQRRVIMTAWKCFWKNTESRRQKPLEELERKALSEDVPIIRSGTRDMFAFFFAGEKPKEVLEIGTAVGFSALCMREYLPKSSHITTIEKVEMRLKEARKNLERMDEDNRITLLEGDAAEVLKELLTKRKIL